MPVRRAGEIFSYKKIYRISLKKSCLRKDSPAAFETERSCFGTRQFKARKYLRSLIMNTIPFWH